MRSPRPGSARHGWRSAGQAPRWRVLPGRWQNPDGWLDLAALLREFQWFWRWHSDEWERTSEYPEAFPHLLCQSVPADLFYLEHRLQIARSVLILQPLLERQHTRVLQEYHPHL